jgi:hypothetical protein
MTPAERITELEAKIDTITTDVNYVGGVQYWIKKHDSILTKLGEALAARAAKDKLAADKEYTESLAKDICAMEDALGFKNDCRDKDGAFVPTIGPWLERVRDLIAAEGEVGDLRYQLAATQKAIAAKDDALRFYATTTIPDGGHRAKEALQRQGETTP